MELGALETALSSLLGAEIRNLQRLAGGASRETWAFDAVAGDAVRPLILRRDPPGALRTGMALEATLLAAAAGAGVPVPAVVATSDEPAVLGAAFVVMERVDGESVPRRILRDEGLSGARSQLAAQCGEILAAIHRIPLEGLPALDGQDPLRQWRAVLDDLGQPHPAFELGFRWLDAHRPPSRPPALVHGDFRNGNLIVGPDGVRAVLDWELAHAGNPVEDLGWLCVRSWRFGAGPPVGGFGGYDDLLDAYVAAGGAQVSRDELHWWETLGTLRWGVICILQAMTHVNGALRSVDLAAIGRRVCEVEWDVLRCLGLAGDEVALDEAPVRSPASSAPGAAGTAPHDLPSAGGLLEAARELLHGPVLDATSGRVRYEARVAGNILAIVERELALGPAHAAEHEAGLRSLGFGSEAELAQAVRAGSPAADAPEVVAFVRRTVQRKLEVANPAYI